ncbi:MAG: NAD-glutamate dehydrogenase [Acidimicrobiia bacterium]
MPHNGATEDAGSPMLDLLIAAIPSDESPEWAKMFSAFAAAYVRRIPEADLPDLPPDQLYAEIADLLRFVDSRGSRPHAVRVFNPTVDTSGYETVGTVIEVVVDDMPFLVDSVANVVAVKGAGIERHLHPLIGTIRDEDGSLVDIAPARTADRTESVQYFELDQALDDDQREVLAAAIDEVLGDVALAVRDFGAMRDAVGEMMAIAKKGISRYGYEEIDETVEFLEWLLDDNFVFLGYKVYDISENGDLRIQSRAGSGLGVLSKPGRAVTPIALSDLPNYVTDRYFGGNLVVITKTNRHSTVHRDARMDYIGIRETNDEGRTTTEYRLIGLFTSKAYMATPSDIPVLRRKLARILDEQDMIEGSHDYKVLVQLFESFPKDDLFAMSVEDLNDTLSHLVDAEESEHVRMFVRRDALKRSVSVLVTVPRDRFNAALRQQLQQLFKAAFHGKTIDYRLSLGESGDARIHFSVWTEGGAPIDVDLASLEAQVIALARNWEDRIVDALAAVVGESEANRLATRWTSSFPDYYKTSTALDLSVGDIVCLDRLEQSGADLVVGLQNEAMGGKGPSESEPLTRITVYRSTGNLHLSAMMPLLEHLGVVVVEEVPTRLKGEDDTFIHDFGVVAPGGAQLDVDAIRDRVSAAIEAVLSGTAESDSLHRLLVTSGLDHAQLSIIRAYRNYWRLVTPAFSVGYMDDAFAAHPDIAEALIELFDARFGKSPDADAEREITKGIRKGLDGVASLDEDRILRGFLGLVLATQRTNMHVKDRQSLALKFSSEQVPEMPSPKPLYEIYVSAPEVEAVHLRGGAVARGGIRWSDRREDYRTEVLGLMKAQNTKNVVIVPTGAKGGFVIRRSTGARPSFDEVKEGYRIFIRGLLDLTDNRVGSAIVPPPDVVRHDGDDPYLVVAADKGTATFSDMANELAADYGFWLDDAFASGGSAGYDHKALGITARGAWESVRRHFYDLGVDIATDEITVVGIGDMSGDVFGNGMLLSKHLKLVAAFDHRHIFLDPEPDPAVAWDERKRISQIPRSSWADYNPDLISTGGGVFERTDKSIELTPEMRAALDTTAESVSPNDLIRAVLKAPVDLLWNGGIGTYIKARSESSEQVQDRSNDAVRINGRDVRARVIGEGGNLGVTQLGRVEYDRNGGQVFADFIDNSGGVHASDREVNLKILLRIAEEGGLIDRAERDDIIESVSGDVVAAILYDNFLQAQILSQESAVSTRTIEQYGDLMDRLEREGILDRDIEFLPTTDEMAQRGRDGAGMARPELAVLLAYAKRHLTALLVDSDLPDDPHFEADLMAYFPPTVSERFADQIKVHPLRRELISTIVANQVLNALGSTFYSRMRTLTGDPAARIVRAFRAARAITGASERWLAIEGLAGKVDPDVYRELLQDVDRLVSIITRWYLNQPVSPTSIDDEIALSKDQFAALAKGMPTLDPPEWREPYEAMASEMIARGVPEPIALAHGFQRALRRAPDIIDLALRHGRDAMEIAGIYTQVSHEFRVDWIERKIRDLPGSTTFERLAAESLLDDLQHMRRSVVAFILDESGGSLEAHFERFPQMIPRRDRLFSWLERDGINDVSAGLIAIRRLTQIAMGR